MNLLAYGGWLIELNTPGVLLAFARAARRAACGIALAMLAFFVLLCACYLFYTRLDTWPFLRFLLPAIPLLFILSSAVVVRAVSGCRRAADRRGVHRCARCCRSGT